MKLSEFLEGAWDDEHKQLKQNESSPLDGYYVPDALPRRLDQAPCNVLTLAIDGILLTNVVQDPLVRFLVFLRLLREHRERCSSESQR